MTVAGLSLLWFIPLAAVLWLAETIGQALPRRILGVWSGLAHLPAPWAAFVIIATATAVYIYAYAGLTLWRIAAWIGAGRRALTTQDAQALCPLGLYLRPFAADPRSVASDPEAVYPFTWQQSDSLSGKLVEILEKTHRRLDGTHLDQFLGPKFRRCIGDLVALGDPHDWLPRRGAARIYPSNPSSADWQTAIIELVNRSQVILLLAGESSGLAWELQYLRQHVPARKVIMLTPPAQPTSTWETQVQALVDAGWTIPSRDPGPGCLIGFDESYRGFLFWRGAREARDYITAMAAYLHGIIGVDEIEWPNQPSPPQLPSILGLG